MRHMPATIFKARCLRVMKEVQATGEAIVITKRGTPIVKLIPAGPQARDIFGFMRDEFEITGDIESPIVWLKQWELLKK